MAFDPTGNFSRLHSWQQDRDNGIRILADRHDEEDDNFAGGFNLCFLRTGTVPMTGNLQMGGNSVHTIKAGSAAAPSLTWELSNGTGLFQPNPNAIGFSAQGVERFQVNNTGVAIIGDTAFGGNTSFAGNVVIDPGNLNVTGDGALTGGLNVGGTVSIGGTLGVEGTAVFGPSMALRDDATDNGDIYLNFNNHANTIAHAYIGVDPAKKMVLRCIQGEIHSVNDFYADAKLGVAGTSIFTGKATFNGSIGTGLIQSGFINGTLVLNGGDGILANGGSIALRGDTSAFTPGGLELITNGISRLYITKAGVTNVTGDANVSGKVTAAAAQIDSIGIHDASFYLGYGAEGPIINFDANDYMYYNRAANAWGINIAGAGMMSITGGDTLNLGVSTMWLRGANLLFQHDGTNGFIRTQNNGPLYLGANGQNLLMVSNDGNCSATNSFFAGNQLVARGSVIAMQVAAGTGYTKINPGGPANAGAIEFFLPDGSRGSYIGNMPSATGVMWYGNDKGGGHLFTGGGIRTASGDANIDGKVMGVANPSDGVCFEVRDVPANSKNTSIRFINNAITAAYGSIGYAGNVDMWITNGIGNLVLNAALKVISQAEHSFVSNAFGPAFPTTAGGANAVFASSGGQFLRSTSSKRYKKNIQDLPDPEGIIDKLRPVSFNSTSPADDPDRVFYGLIAEEVAELDANIVDYNEEGLPEGLNYQAFIPLAIKGMQALRKRVKHLEAHIHGEPV